MLKVTSSLIHVIIQTLFFTILTIYCEGQTIESTPYLRTEHAIKPLYFTFINPSAPSSTSRIFSAIGYQSGVTDARKRIRSFYANSLIRISHKDSLHQSHFLGLGISSSQEGPLLTQNEFTLKYELRLPLNENSLLKAGIDIGTINYDIGSSGRNGGISAFVPNGHVGLTYVYQQNSEFGISMNQIFNNTFDISTTQPTQLVRHYNLHGSHLFTTNPLHQLRLFVWDKHVPDLLNSFGGYVSYYYRNKTAVSLGLDSNFQCVFSIGVTNWRVDQNNIIDVFMAYSVPLLNTSMNFGNIEFGLNFKLL